MTLLDKKTHLIVSGLACLLIPFFFACDDPNELGLELETDDSPLVVRDTVITLSTSTIYMDSLRTDHFSVNSFGKYTDSIYGDVTAIAYQQYNLSETSLPDSIQSFESAAIRLRVASVRASGQLSNQQISIHEAQDTLFTQGVYLADRTVPFNPEPVTTQSLNYNPALDSILTIPLDESHGLQFYEMITKAVTDSLFRDSLFSGRIDFAPLVMVPGEDNNGLFTFDLADDTTGIYINMRDESGDLIEFTFNFQDVHYTKVEREIGSSEVIPTLDDNFKEDSTASRTYLDMLAGIYTKIDLRNLLTFVKQYDNLLINISELTLEVANSNDLGFNPDKQPLLFYFVKNGNESKYINGPSIAIATNQNNPNFNLAWSNALLSESAYQNRVSSLLSPTYNEEDRRYESNITLFTQILADNYRLDQDFLAEELLVLNSNALRLAQTSFFDSEIKVTLYYTTLAE